MAYIRQRRGLGDIQTVAQTIQQIEGWYPGSRSFRNFNPCNLRCANQMGMIGCDPSNFAIFPDYQTGYDAELAQIRLDASRGFSIADFTAKYAPASDANDPASYAAKIAQATGLSVSDPLAAALADSGEPAGPSFAAMLPDNLSPWVFAGISVFGLMALASLFSD